MKTLIAVAVLSIALMVAVTACNDRTRDNCETKPTATRCDQ
jgi:hypothetical protein